MKFSTTGENLRGVSGVYCAIHRDSGMCYVGSSVDIGNRIVQHLSSTSRGSLNAFHRAIRAFPDGFDFEVLERCEKRELVDRERFYIVLLNSASVDGFNTRSNPTLRYGFKVSEATKHRTSAALIGIKRSDQTKGKISAAKKGVKFSEEHKARISSANKGRKHSEESKANMSAAAMKGIKLSKEHMAKMAAARKGRKLSEEHKAKLTGKRHSEETKTKMSAARKGRKLSEEHKAKLSAFQTGRKHSDEAKAKMAAAKLGKKSNKFSRKTSK